MADPDRNSLRLAVAGIGAANALARPLANAFTEGGAVAALAAVNPAIWVALTLALFALAGTRRRPVRTRDLRLAGFALAGFLVPSATVSWLVLGAFALALLPDRTLSTAQRTGALILAVTALREPTVAVAMHLFNEPLLGLDAALAAAALAPFVPDAHAEGNLVVAADSLRLVILTSCSSLTNLSHALLFWFAVSRTLHPRLDGRAIAAGLLIAVSVVGLNVLRLALMATSDAGYDSVHGPDGRQLFEVAMLAAVLGLTYFGARDAHAQPHGPDPAAAARAG